MVPDFGAPFGAAFGRRSTRTGRVRSARRSSRPGAPTLLVLRVELETDGVGPRDDVLCQSQILLAHEHVDRPETRGARVGVVKAAA